MFDRQAEEGWIEVCDDDDDSGLNPNRIQEECMLFALCFWGKANGRWEMIRVCGRYHRRSILVCGMIGQVRYDRLCKVSMMCSFIQLRRAFQIDSLFELASVIGKRHI